MATPSLAMIPSAYADSKVYSVLPNNGDGDFSFNRDSSATRVGQNGLIQTVGFFGNDLVTNGDFSNGSTDWGLGSNWSVANGKASCDGSASNSMSQASTVGIASTTFKVSYDVLSISQGSIRITLGGVAGSSVSQVGSYSDFITATSTDRLRIFADSSAIASIDNIVVQQVTGDQPRLNYDISNGAVQSCPSLLLEPARTNLATYSEDFSNAYWTKEKTSITSNAVISPDGTLNASKLVEDSSAGLHRTYSNLITTAQNNDYTSSVFAKKGGRNIFGIQTSSGAQPYVWFNLDKGIIELQQSNIVGKIESLPNGWYKCSATWNSSSATNDRVFIQLAESTSNTSYTGDGTSGVYLWGAQFEQSSYPTSYIPTNGSSQTRAAETCFGAGTASTFNSTEGVLYAEISALANDGTSRVISLSDSSDTNRVHLFYNVSANTINVNYRVAGSSKAIMSFAVSDVTIMQKIAYRWQSGNFELYINGVSRGTDTNTVMMPSGTMNQLAFNVGGGTSYFHGNTKDLRVYNEALTDAQLQTLTTL